MEEVAEADTKVFLWINGWVGRFPFLDAIMEVVVSDYVIPVALALTLLGLWFLGADPDTRERHQKTVFVATSALGLASLTVFIINGLYFRPRPFTQHEVSLLFYQPTDPSFPANPAGVTFAIAAGVWGANRRVGAVLYALAALFAFSRVYAGVFYPLDVIGGALIGVAAAYLTSRLRMLLEPLPTLVIRLARVFCLA